MLILTGDGSGASDGRCATCAIYSIECTYNDHLKVCKPDFGPFSSQLSHPNPSHQDPEGAWILSEFCRNSNVCSYVQHLENRVANLERLLREARSALCIYITPLLSPRNSTPVEMELETPHPRSLVVPSQILMWTDTTLGRFPPVPTLNQRTWTLYHPSQKRRAIVTMSSSPQLKQTSEAPDLYKSPVGSPAFASTERAVCLHSPVAPSTKGVKRPLQVVHVHTGRSFGLPLM